MRIKTDKKSMLGIYVPMLRRLTKLKLENLKVEGGFSVDGEQSDFTITVFDNSNDNLTFNFYSWQEIADIEKKVKLFFTTIKTGSLDKIRKRKEELDI